MTILQPSDRVGQLATNAMREIRIIIEDKAHFFTDQPLIKKGRPRKPKRRLLPFQLDTLPHDFYIVISELKKENVGPFIQKYQITNDATGSIVTKTEIVDFQKELACMIQYFDEIQEQLVLAKKNKIGALTDHAIQRKARRYQSNALEKINEYLAKCRLGFSFVGVTGKHLSPEDKRSFETQLEEMDNEHSGLLRDNVLKDKAGEGQQNTNSPVLTIGSGIFSWCVLCLVADRLQNRPIGLCNGPGHVQPVLFLKNRKNAEYCKNCTSQVRSAARMRKKRAKN